ncbi:MAG TPA: L-seryl-tRNA(Sec) selenium transferase [Terriglobia bacterium]|nr:L-seryl-tRNA(Sec) selenium transferase [Terriglobia bacterium]
MASQIRTQPEDLLRQISSVDELLHRPAIRALEPLAGHALLREAVRDALQALRERVARGVDGPFSAEGVEREVRRRVEAELVPSLVAVINATGVILHTNLGRAPLARQAVERVAEVAARYSNLEYDLAQGERGKRDAHTDRLLASLVGAEAALVVNNNAAAVFLALNTLAEGGEVVVSRGELIEIGGSFRIPDICAKSGAVLREAGTTNRTRLADYAAAINERTRLLLRVHPSNFRIVGFTERPALAELVELGHRHNIPVMEDLGSGCLVDLDPCGLRDEPPAGPSLAAGAQVVTFSGAKLLGGPQAGIIAGAREPLRRIRRNPLFRALRVDKMTIAALEATARLYRSGQIDSIPALAMIRASAESIAVRAAHLQERLGTVRDLAADLERGESVAGGGSSPGQSLPTTLVALQHARLSSGELAERLRQNRPPVIARVERDRVLIDLRTVLDEHEESEIVRALERIVSG